MNRQLKVRLIGISILIILVTIVMFSTMSRRRSSTDQQIKDIWQSVVGKEYRSDDGWAGMGLYFYEDVEGPVVTWMLYGSGVPVIDYFTSPVSIDENGLIHFSVPEMKDDEKLMRQSLDDEVMDKTMIIKDGQIVMDDGAIFSYDEKGESHKRLWEMIDGGFWSQENETQGQKTDNDQSWIYVYSPISSYNPGMSSVPGMPIEIEVGSLQDSKGLTIEAESGRFIHYEDDKVELLSNVITTEYKNQRIYWSPMDYESGDLVTENEIILSVVITNSSDGQTDSIKIPIYWDGISYSLNSLGSLQNSDMILEEGFALYGLTENDNVTDFVISEEPILTQANIKQVDWENQIFYFTEDFLDRIEADNTKTDVISGSDLLGGHKKFMVTADGTVIYEGWFQVGGISSFYPTGPVIEDVGKEGIQIIIQADSINDPRYDERILTVLERYDLLK